MANSSSRSEGHRSAGIRTSPVEEHSREDPSIGSRDGDAQRRERGDQKVFMHLMLLSVMACRSSKIGLTG